MPLADAIPIPMSCFTFRFSLSIRAESTAMSIGNDKQTRIAAIEALARATTVT